MSPNERRNVSLNDKMNELPDTRREAILAEADDLHTEYQAQSAQGDEKTSDDLSLEHKLNELPDARREAILAEADRLNTEYHAQIA